MGLGARSDLDAARGFVGDTGVSSLPMVWDQTGETWVDLGVATQPAAVLFDRDGTELGRWSVVDEDEVLAELAG